MPSNEYHSYVIQDGKLIGKFEEMYQNCEDPWLQEASIDSCPLRNLIAFYCKQLNVSSIVEIGCGTGRLANNLHQITGAKVLGMDISQTAIKRAEKRYPGPDFMVGTARDVDAIESFAPQAIVMCQLTWYILPELRSIIDAFKTRFKGSYLLHQLAFYPADKQKYGREYFTDVEGLISYLELEIVSSIKVDTFKEKNVATSYDTLLLAKL